MPSGLVAAGVSDALEKMVAEQLFQQRLRQEQEMALRRLRLDEDRHRETVRQNDLTRQRTARIDRESDAANLVSGLDATFDPESPLDVEVPEAQAEQLAGTPSAARVRTISALQARPVSSELAGTIDETPGVGVRRLAPTGEQRAARRGVERDRAASEATDTAIAGLPEGPRRIANLRRLGVQGVSAEDFETPEQRQARLQDDEDSAVRRAGRIAEAQAGAAAKFREPRASATPKLPAAMAQQAATSQTALDALDRLERAFKPEFVGPAAGRFNRFERGAPQILRDALPDAPQGFEAFNAEVATLKNEMIRAITGAAVSAQEQTRIMQQIPDVTDTPENFLAKLEVSRRNLQALLANIARSGAGAVDQPLAPGTEVDIPQNGALAELERRRRERRQ